MSALPLTYIVRAANVNDKDLVEPLLKQAHRAGKLELTIENLRWREVAKSGCT